MRISKAEAVKAIEGINGGHFFTVKFIKRGDGSLRTMNCRKDVSKGTTGRGLNFDLKKKGLISVWDRRSKSFRFISTEGIRSLSYAGETYKVA